jgi:hypothetical protein
MYVKWKLVSVCLEIVLVSAQDRCMVCAECTLGIKIILDIANGTSNVGQKEARFDPFGDSVNLDTRYVHGLRRMCTSSMEILSGTLAGTPR